MNRVAIAFNTCDRVELTNSSIEPLLQSGKFDLHWCDGSKTEEGQTQLDSYYRNNSFHFYKGIHGGSGPAIVFALTKMLDNFREYEIVGLVENDVLLDQNFFDDMMALFERGKQDGLEVGAVSARCYEDRILFQRDG